MRLFLTGIDGQVGFELQRALAPLGEVIGSTLSGLDVAGAACEPLDLTAPEQIKGALDRIRPQVIINPAAYTAVDKSESEPSLARSINAEAPARIAAWCKNHDALLVHYSTDYVFSGEQARPWREDDPVGPLGVYGQSKLAGEIAIRDSGCRHLILRTAWVYSARFGNFLKTMLRVGAERDQLSVVSDQFGAPTTARGLAELTAALLARHDQLSDDRLGTFHAVHGGQASWHEFAEALFARALRAGLLAKAPTVAAITTADYPTAARRPAYSVLDCGKLRSQHGLQLPHWSEGLDQVIAELAAR